MTSSTNLKDRHRLLEEAKEDTKLRQAEVDNAVRFVMGTPAGRRFIWWLLDQAGMYRTSFTGNSTTFFNEGMRNMGLNVLDRVHAVCPDQYAVMVKESQKEKENNGTT